MRILIATDAWRPQVNGVVSTLERMTQAAGEFGARFEFLTPQGMWTAPLPTYPEIRLAISSSRRIGRRIEEAAPDHIHIATEGPIGLLVRRRCVGTALPSPGVSNPLSRICRSPRARAQSLGRGLGVDDVALVSRRNSRGDGGDPCARR